jgi:6-phosphogluconolactonase (cycloisomerase 2 family)
MSDGSMHGAVYVQSNEADNAIIAFRRATDGALERLGSYTTEGSGDGEPHLPSQGSVMLSGDSGFVLVTNAASNDVTVLRVLDGGALEVAGKTSAGGAPKSVAEHEALVYVLATDTPEVNGFRLTRDGLDRIIGAEQELSAPEADPAQVGFTPDGSALIVTDRATNSIEAFPIREDGTLAPSQVVASSGPTPYGFGFTSTGTLVVTEAFGARKGAAAASSYKVDAATITPVTRSVGNGRSEICWAAVTPDDRYAFTTNFADGAVSRFEIAADGSLTIGDATAGLSVDGRPGLRDEGLTADGRFLYAIDADAGAIFGWAVGAGGELSPVGSWDGLPATVAGLAAR